MTKKHITENSGNLIKWKSLISGEYIEGACWTNHSGNHKMDIDILKTVINHLLDNYSLDYIKAIAVNDKTKIK